MCNSGNVWQTCVCEFGARTSSGLRPIHGIGPGLVLVFVLTNHVQKFMYWLYFHFNSLHFKIAWNQLGIDLRMPCYTRKIQRTLCLK